MAKMYDLNMILKNQKSIDVFMFMKYMNIWILWINEHS